MTRRGQAWPRKPLREVARFRSGGTPNRATPEFWGGDIPWFTAKDLKVLRLDSAIQTLTDAGARNGTRVLGDPAVLVLVRGMTLLKRVPISVTTRPSAFNQDVVALVPEKGLRVGFLGHWLAANERRLRTFVDIAGHGTGRLPVGRLKTLQIPLPSCHEQERIESILDSLDGYLTRFPLLLDAKRRFKRGLAQQLLTGKRRFKEFVRSPDSQETAAGPLPKDWGVRPLRELVTPITRRNSGRVTLVLTASGEHGLVDQRDYFNRSVAGEDLGGYYLLKKGEFAYNRSLMKNYPFGAIKRLEGYDEGALSTLYLCFGLTAPGQSADFYAHVFEAGMLNRQLSKIINVGARAHGLLNVTADDFYSLRVPEPSGREQQAIADVLSACDREIHFLERLQSAVDSQRCGVAELLLTGKVRIPA